MLDEERVAEYKAKKKRLPKEGFPERKLDELTHVVPACYGMMVHKARVVKLRPRFPRIHVKYLADEHGATHALALPPVDAYLHAGQLAPV